MQKEEELDQKQKGSNSNRNKKNETEKVEDDHSKIQKLRQRFQRSFKNNDDDNVAISHPSSNKSTKPQITQDNVLKSSQNENSSKRPPLNPNKWYQKIKKASRQRSINQSNNSISCNSQYDNIDDLENVERIKKLFGTSLRPTTPKISLVSTKQTNHRNHTVLEQKKVTLKALLLIKK